MADDVPQLKTFMQFATLASGGQYMTIEMPGRNLEDARDYFSQIPDTMPTSFLFFEASSTAAQKRGECVNASALYVVSDRIVDTEELARQEKDFIDIFNASKKHHGFATRCWHHRLSPEEGRGMIMAEAVDLAREDRVPAIAVMEEGGTISTVSVEDHVLVVDRRLRPLVQGAAPVLSPKQALRRN